MLEYLLDHLCPFLYLSPSPSAAMLKGVLVPTAREDGLCVPVVVGRPVAPIEGDRVRMDRKRVGERGRPGRLIIVSVLLACSEIAVRRTH